MFTELCKSIRRIFEEIRLTAEETFDSFSTSCFWFSARSGKAQACMSEADETNWSSHGSSFTDASQ